MSDLIVIYDASKELAAIINVETRCAWGPAMLGDGAGEVLQGFIDATPFDMDTMSTEQALAAFEQFLGRLSETVVQAPSEAAGGALAGDVTVADVVAAAGSADYAERGTEPPGVAPADTDTPQDTASQSTVMRCYNCDGRGVIEFGDDQPTQQCNMCRGTGKISVVATA